MQCDACGEAMEREVVTIDVNIAGRLASIDQPSWYCWTCRLGAHTASDLAIGDAELPTPNGERTSR
jgi:hypothetical protein